MTVASEMGARTARSIIISGKDVNQPLIPFRERPLKRESFFMKNLLAIISATILLVTAAVSISAESGNTTPQTLQKSVRYHAADAVYDNDGNQIDLNATVLSSADGRSITLSVPVSPKKETLTVNLAEKRVVTQEYEIYEVPEGTTLFFLDMEEKDVPTLFDLSGDVSAQHYVEAGGMQIQPAAPLKRIIINGTDLSSSFLYLPTIMTSDKKPICPRPGTDEACKLIRIIPSESSEAPAQ